MKNYLFYIEGLNREVWIQSETMRLGFKDVWQSLTDEEQDAVVQIECLDEVDVDTK